MYYIQYHLRIMVLQSPAMISEQISHPSPEHPHLCSSLSDPPKCLGLDTPADVTTFAWDLSHEVADHNATRSKVQHYLTKIQLYERQSTSQKRSIQALSAQVRSLQEHIRMARYPRRQTESALKKCQSCQLRGSPIGYRGTGWKVTATGFV